jgi:hypothetical protein
LRERRGNDVTAVPTNATFEAVQAIQRAPSVGKIKEVLRRVADHRGYEFFHCSAPPPVGADVIAPVVVKYLTFSREIDGTIDPLCQSM